MSRFNSPSLGTKTVNLAGGQAFSQSPELELVSILLTSFAKDQFYKSADDSFARLKELIPLCDKSFVAKAAIYARTKFGMRSITHVVASELAKYVGGQTWGQKFYDRIVYRPDDLLEILSYHLSKNGKLTNAMRKGFAKSFDRFDKYTLAKYRGEGKAITMIDAVNLVHPKPIDKNAAALDALMKGDLKSFDTWETELTKAGQVAETDEQKTELKKEAWIKLIREKKLGYFALLRNLRNIISQAPEVLQEALEMLVDEKLIKKSLVLPFRYTTAYEEIQKMAGIESGAMIRSVMVYLNKAVDIAVSNVPKFPGETLVVLDVSGSMEGKPAQIGSLLAAVLIKSNNADFMTFDGDARYKNVNPMDSTITIANSIKFASGSTNFHAIFERANKAYDRIIILSDMQGWVGGYDPTATFAGYKMKYKTNPFVYSFDLQGYGSMQFPAPQVFALAGFSEKIFDIMSFMETDKAAMINEIKKIEL